MTGHPELDALIEDFRREPYDEYGDTVEMFRDPEQAHGNCADVTGVFVAFAKARGFKAYATDTDMEEMGYTPRIAPFGEIGFDENDEMQYGFYPEHTVASIYVEGQRWPIIIDWTAAQYGYTEFPKITT